VIFFKTDSGREPVRDWIMSLTDEQRKTVGTGIRKVQSEWPIGMPHVRSLGDGLHEVRSNFPDGIARTLFYIVDGGRMILLHGFTKKTQKTPRDDLALAKKRKKIHETHIKKS
jgi:phage-related protein